ncbi:TOBE domain-containing protein [Grimontia marina]|uniref:TOBE domain-containing protein n=1 Tax=Grimontia marina TaxID=646534 RepID=UPI0022B68B21|nr:TOBE domain-containing protein [Grimontia marina]
MGLRPEHLQIAENPKDKQLTMKVTLTESLGADLLVYGTLSDSNQQMTLRVEGHVVVEDGASLPLTIDTKNIHLFDRETEKRIES